MEPNADGFTDIADVSPETAPGAPIVDEALAALGSNGHAEPVIDGDSFDLRHMLQALQAMRVGDFSVRMPADRTGLAGKIADTFNEIVAPSERRAHELEYVGQVVGREGKTRQRVKFGLANGAWGEMEDSVNTLIDDLLWPTTAVTHAITDRKSTRLNSSH